MNCKKIQEKLIDFIEGDLSKEEELEIEEHLSECEDCKREYEEIQATIKYIKDESRDIGDGETLSLNTNIRINKNFKRFTRTGIIAMAISLLLVVTAIATEMFGFMDWWQNYSEEQIISWDQLIEDGLGKKLDISTCDKDIKVTVKGVVADDLNTMILIEVENLKKDIKFTPVDISISGDIEREGKDLIEGGFPITVNRVNLYNDDGKSSVILTTEAMSKDEGEINIEIKGFESMINEDLESIINIKGKWKLKLTAKKLEALVYDIDEKIKFDGNELLIEKIIIAPTATKIEYGYQIYNEEKEYYLRDISFAIESNRKIYKRPILDAGLDSGLGYKDYGYQNSAAYLQSLYLEKPKDFKLIVEAYEYDSGGRADYDIEWNKLPQALEYQGSAITVKDVKYNENSTEIILEEDKSRNRKYIDSKIYMEKQITKQYLDENEEVNIDLSRNIYANMSIFQVKDKMGEIKSEYNYGEVTGNMDNSRDRLYYFSLEKKLLLSEESLGYSSTKIIIDKEEFLKPSTITIEGQSFIEYPNIKKRIKLK